MYTTEANVDRNSDYYVYTASAIAQKTFFYPICIGLFHYLPGYHLIRDCYDNYLLMYIKKGTCTVRAAGKQYVASEGQIVFLDCHNPHEYLSDTGWDGLWMHFDSIIAHQYFELITASKQFVFTLKDNYFFRKTLTKIYSSLQSERPMKEAIFSQYISSLLTELMIGQHETASLRTQSSAVDEAIRYINDHLKDNLSLSTLASHVALSPFYFTRLFKKETGFTPHEYILTARITNAKFLLKNTPISIKEICYQLGFSAESRFCTTFKSFVHMTPSEYRNSKS